MAVVTGIAAALPGGAGVDALLGDGIAPGAPPVDPAARLGRRGLRYKDRATQLGLFAAADALAAAGLLDGDGLAVDGHTVGVVVSSNLGNVDTVCRVAETIARDGVTATSPMDLPNASSNIVASTIAIRFGLRGINLTLCNGETSGLDAMWWAATLVAAGRAEHVVVVGVEPANAHVARLYGATPRLDGAAAVVVEADAVAARRRHAPLAAVGGYARRGDLPAAVAAAHGDEAVGLWLDGGTTGTGPARGRDGSWGGRRLDVTRTLGGCSGALGVIQCATAAQWLATGGEAAVVACAGGDDAWAALEVLPPGQHEDRVRGVLRPASAEVSR